MVNDCNFDEENIDLEDFGLNKNEFDDDSEKYNEDDNEIDFDTW